MQRFLFICEMGVSSGRCLVLFFICASFVKVEGQEYDLLSVVNLLLNYFGIHNSTVNVINAVDIDRKFVDDVLKITSAQLEMAFEVADPEYTNDVVAGLKLNYAIIADKFDAVNEFFSCFNPKIYDIRGYFLIVVLSPFQEKDILELFRLIWRAKIFTLNIIHAEGDEVFSTMFVPFQENSCEGKLSNRTFVTRKFIPDLPQMFPSMLLDMKDCPVKVTTFETSKVVIKKGNQFSGRDFELIKTLSKYLHFSLDIEFLEEENPWGFLFENGTATGAIAKLLKGETDLIFGDYFLDRYGRKLFDYTVPYFQARLIYVIPPKASFSSFQKLSQPFRRNVWISLVAFYAFAIVSIIVINRLPEKFRNIIFGYNITSPLTNMFLATLGISQATVPIGRFARSLLIMFLLFCLVIRSSYQGSLYRFLQSDGSEEIKSFDEFISKDFRFYIGTSYKDFTHNNVEFNKKRVNMSGSQDPIFKRFDNPNFKGTLITRTENINVYNREQTYNITFNILKSEIFSTLSIVMYYRKNFFLGPGINEIVQRLQSAGVIEHWHYIYFPRTKNQEADSRKPLNIDHLTGAFGIWAGGNAVGLLIFIFEIIFRRLSNFLKKRSN